MQPGAATGGLSAGVSSRRTRLRDSHGSHGGTISALLLYAVASAAMPVVHAVTAEGLKSRKIADPESQ
jgi:hypothetical protein